MILADTGAVVAMVDRNDRHPDVLRALLEEGPDRWVLPWAILPEVDYLLSKYVGGEAERYFLEDVAGGAYLVEWNGGRDLARAAELNARHAELRLGLVDAVVLAMAERLLPEGDRDSRRATFRKRADPGLASSVPSRLLSPELSIGAPEEVRDTIPSAARSGGTAIVPASAAEPARVAGSRCRFRR